MADHSNGESAAPSSGLLFKPLAAIADPEGQAVPQGLGPVIDAHVHAFPDELFRGIWQWFDRHGWPVRYQLPTDHLLNFLCERGVERLVLLHYAHKPGLAEQLNPYVASLCRRDERFVGTATVFPGEPDSRGILERGFGLGLKAVKLHCHVQCFALDDPAMEPVYDSCVTHGRPLVVHAGREPKSPAYRCDPYELCSAARVEQVLRTYPELKLCVPHLGLDEFSAYQRLLQRYDNLWLDTAMALAKFFDVPSGERLLRLRPERIMYGSDYPNIPYAWDRELKLIAELGLEEPHLRALLADNARAFFGLDESVPA